MSPLSLARNDMHYFDSGYVAGLLKVHTQRTVKATSGMSTEEVGGKIAYSKSQFTTYNHNSLPPVVLWVDYHVVTPFPL